MAALTLCTKISAPAGTSPGKPAVVVSMCSFPRIRTGIQYTRTVPHEFLLQTGRIATPVRGPLLAPWTLPPLPPLPRQGLLVCLLLRTWEHGITNVAPNNPRVEPVIRMPQVQEEGGKRRPVCPSPSQAGLTSRNVPCGTRAPQNQSRSNLPGMCHRPASWQLAGSLQGSKSPWGRAPRPARKWARHLSF